MFCWRDIAQGTIFDSFGQRKLYESYGKRKIYAERFLLLTAVVSLKDLYELDED